MAEQDEPLALVVIWQLEDSMRGLDLDLGELLPYSGILPSSMISPLIIELAI
jgi:hypothetical protein